MSANRYHIYSATENWPSHRGRQFWCVARERAETEFATEHLLLLTVHTWELAMKAANILIKADITERRV